MNRAIFLGLIAYALLLAALLSLHGEMLLLVIPVGLFLLAGTWRSPRELRLEATRSLSTERALPDAPVQIMVTIRNRGEELDEVFLQDLVPARLKVVDGSPCALVRLERGATQVLSYSVQGPRGGYAFEAVTAEANEDLGLSGRHGRMQVRNQLFVFPTVTRLRHITIRPRRTRVYAGNIPARAGGNGIEFFGVRDYQPGDSSRSINWRVSARHIGTLYSNEFQQERVADVGIVLDGRLRTNALGREHSLFEHSIQAAASLADAFLFQGNRVGLLLYSNFLAWTYPDYGKVQRERILQALARAQPGDSQVFTALEYIPTRLFPPESQIVVVSPLTEDDLLPLRKLRALGYQVMVISPDPVSLEMSYLEHSPAVEMARRIVSMERRLLLQRARRAGVQVMDWNIHQPLDLAVQKSLGRPPGWLQAIGS